MIHIFGFTSMLLTLLMAGCKDGPVDPPPPPPEKKWEAVSEFTNLDIRYMIHFKDELYAAVVNYKSDTLYEGAVLKTSDGNSWSLVKTFKESIGPMTVEGDSLYVNGDHFIYKMDIKGNWVIKFEVPWQIAKAEWNGDMIFLKGNLYIAQTRLTGRMYMVTPDSVWKAIFPFGSENGPACAKFVKLKKNNIETAYFRQTATIGSIHYFDGELATFLREGLPKSFTGANSMVIHNDTLFAGFKQIPSGSSGMIMFLDNNEWKLYHDSLPNSKSAFNYTPRLTTLPTVILYVGERMFVASDVYGVLEWKYEKGWQKMNDGLVLMLGEPKENELYTTIAFLEYFKGKLFVGYGRPASLWGTWESGLQNGLLKYQLE